MCSSYFVSAVPVFCLWPGTQRRGSGVKRRRAAGGSEIDSAASSPAPSVRRRRKLELETPSAPRTPASDTQASETVASEAPGSEAPASETAVSEVAVSPSTRESSPDSTVTSSDESDDSDVPLSKVSLTLRVPVKPG